MFGFGPKGWDLDLKARIWALRLRSESEGRGTEEENKEEKIPHMCENIGHRPLWGRCPKTLRNKQGIQCLHSKHTILFIMYAGKVIITYLYMFDCNLMH